MELLVAKLENFGSYKSLEIDFSNKGLILISGPTGSGKSTIQDAPVWVLYGLTAKNGNADEVRSWFSPDAPTKGQIVINLSDRIITITRIRGKQGQNDLWWEDSTGIHRGKDLIDTQKLLNGVLGVSAEEYIVSAYYNEFSPIRNFFYAKAKERRSLLDKIANLEFPLTLNEKLSNGKKESRKAIIKKTEELNQARGRRSQLERSKADCEVAFRSWEKTQKETIEGLKVRVKNQEAEKVSRKAAAQTKYDAYETNRAKKIEDLKNKIESQNTKLSKIASATCKLCGSAPEAATRIAASTESLLQSLSDVIDNPNLYAWELENCDSIENKYEEQLAIEMKRANPHVIQLDKVVNDLAEALKTEDAINTELEGEKFFFNSLDQLSDLSGALRAEILRDSVLRVEEETNRLLETHFDSILKVEIKVQDDDSLDVTILKEGHDCSFTQLSKGQRGFLQLCFSVAVMQASSNKAGVHFNSLFFDESLDGLDGDLKTKAYDLFLELEQRHSSIFVIEHSEELKSLFNNRFSVKLVGEESVIEEQ